MAVLSPTIGASGMYGTVNGMWACKRWQVLSHSTDNPSHSDTRMQGAVHRYKGVEDWRGSYVRDVDSPFGTEQMPGGSIAFFGYATPENGIPGPASPGPTWSGYVMIESVQLTWNWETNDPVTCVTQFAGNVRADSGELAILNTNPWVESPAIGEYTLTPQGRSIEIADADAGEIFDWYPICTSQAVLTFKSNNSTFVNTDTSPFTGRYKGIVDWTLALTMSEADIRKNGGGTSPPFSLLPGASVAVQLPAIAPTYWELFFGRVRDYTNYIVDRETAAIIGYTVNIEMQALYEATELIEDARIAMPDGTIYWPAA